MEAITKKQLVTKLLEEESSIKVALGNDYGDRVNTTEAIPVNEVFVGSIKEHSGTNTGWSFEPECEQNEDDELIEAIILEPHSRSPRNFRTMTAGELIEELKPFDDDMIVVGYVDFGDHAGTLQAVPVTDYNYGIRRLQPSGYSNSEFALVESKPDQSLERVFQLNNV